MLQFVYRQQQRKENNMCKANEKSNVKAIIDHSWGTLIVEFQGKESPNSFGHDWLFVKTEDNVCIATFWDDEKTVEEIVERYLNFDDKVIASLYACEKHQDEMFDEDFA